MNTQAVGLVFIMVSYVIIPPTAGNTNIAKVWKTIVAGAKLIGYNYYIKTYRQSGGLKQAVKDFDALEPRNVKILDDGSRHGKVGNMDVYLERLPLSIVLTGKRLTRQRVIRYQN